MPDPALLDEIADRGVRTTDAPYATSAGPVHCGVSAGLTLGRPGDFAYELLGRADAAMYAHKQVCRLPAARSGPVPTTRA